MTSREPRNMITLSSENLIRNHSDALKYCLQELNREYPDYQRAQVFATLSLEEAVRDLAAAIGQVAGRLV